MPRPLSRELGIGGQSALEATLLMPLFLLLLFAIFQVGHIGIGVALVNHAVSSVAQNAVANDDPKQAEDSQKFNSLLTAGLRNGKVLASLESGDDPVLKNLKVSGCAELPAYPFVGPFLYKALQTTVSEGCAQGAKAFGPVALKGPAPYRFVIHGETIARMNYNAK